jgi:hypothetical protein
MHKSLTLPGVNLKSVAIPAEHGGWMFLLEPVLLGLAVALSPPGMLLGLAALGAFLARHPLKLAISDYRSGRRTARTPWATRFAAFYAAIALGAFTLVLLTARTDFLLPLLIAAPLVLVQLYFDANRRSRELWAELSGAVALGAVASAIALLAGWPLVSALALWLIPIARGASAIPYVRARLRLERGKITPAETLPVWASHLLGLAVLLLCAYANLTPWLSAAVMAVLLGRAVWGLSPWRRHVRAQTVGIQEVIWGFVTIIAVALGYQLGW